jgi:hypothetical protein
LNKEGWKQIKNNDSYFIQRKKKEDYLFIYGSIIHIFWTEIFKNEKDVPGKSICVGNELVSMPTT